MDCCRRLDLARLARRSVIRRGVVLLALACAARLACGQSLSAGDPAAAVRQLLELQRWEEVVRVVGAMPAPSAELHFYRGAALARLGRWSEARDAFLAAHRLSPLDPRILVELAGAEFKQNNYAAAESWLRRALRIGPDDAYANDFLATLYFLQGNTEAALKYWNRAGKPNINHVTFSPVPRMDPVLLDHALAFSPASDLQLRDLLTSEARLRAFGVFPRLILDLDARDDGRFDVVIRAQERNGWGDGKWPAILSTFRGVFYQTLTPEYFNLRRSAINAVALLRWDPDKRRILTSVSGPIARHPGWRYQAGFDLRDENWQVRDSLSSLAPALGGLNLRRQSLSAGLTSIESGRWTWSTGAEVSHRSFGNLGFEAPLPSAGLLRGFQLKYLGSTSYQLLRIPEKRFVLTAGASSQIGRLWSQPARAFSRLQGSLGFSGSLQPRTGDYETRERVSIGKTFGTAPFDELFMLGLERDNDLLLRAHIGTRNGRKGSAPLGQNYFLSNWQTDKNLYSNGLITLRLGPFLDTGKITAPSATLGSQKWLVDTGAQTTMRVLGLGVTFVYGKDLRTGNNAYYTTVSR
jgi:tetratricopeptide (TPR) repeat protein